MGDNAGLEFRNVQKSILAENQEASPRWTQTPHPESPLVEKVMFATKRPSPCQKPGALTTRQSGFEDSTTCGVTVPRETRPAQPGALS
jgi:hypothetical protein